MQELKMTNNRKELSKGEYYSYICSDSWQIVRKRYRESKLLKICYCCGADDEPLDLHHKTYKRLGSERLTDLCKVCRSCHRKIHELAKRKRIPLWSATKQIRKKMQKWAKGD